MRQIKYRDRDNHKDIRISCGITMCGIQDEPNDNPEHIDWVSNVEDILW